LNFFVDTNVLSKVVRGREQNYRLAWEKALGSNEALHASVIVVSELEFGALNSQFPDLTRQRYLSALGQVTEIHPFTWDDAIEAAKLRLHLKKPGQHIGANDIMIAAQALRLGFPIITNNRKHFDLVPNLQVIDWS
jgi:tRNA(fMet)-specific endonuclease VapC